MKIIRISAIVVLILFIAIQFIPKNMPEGQETGGSDLMATIEVSDQVAEILRISCYDCHSFETRYPWYSRVAPSAWLVAKDIREGREELNFSGWADAPLRRQIGMLESIAEEVEKGEMPLAVYTVIHRKAKLDEEQVAAIVRWTEEVTEKILD
jgi:hypothetical protein